MPIIKNLLKLKSKKYSYFTTPSHAQKEPIKSMLGRNYFKVDMSEVDGMDNLNSPEECIFETEELFKNIYNSSFSHMLTSGSTQGMLALMLAVLKKGDKAIIATNCHKCVHNGLVLTGAEPVWVYPCYDKKFGVYTNITANEIAQAIFAHPTAKCVIITNPTYDGIMSDISKIADICIENNIALIVDEAHGALWNFDKTIGTPAILAGADASVQSLHKTCGAVNPASILHLSKDSLIDKNEVMRTLNLISTTSPSYALMCNIEETIIYLAGQKGGKRIEKLLEALTDAIHQIKTLSNIDIYCENNDITKLFIHTSKISAKDAGEILYSKFKIECEIQHAYAMTFLCGIGTTNKKLKKLVKALKYLDKISKNCDSLPENLIVPPKREMMLSPQYAYNANFTETQIENAIGKISAQIITSYPPGIPILTYGERISEMHLNFINPKNKIRIVK